MFGKENPPFSFGKSALAVPLSRLPAASKTGLPVGLAAGAITGVWKSKTRHPQRLPVFTAALFDNYLKKFSRMHIISHLVLENWALLRKTVLLWRQCD